MEVSSIPALEQIIKKEEISSKEIKLACHTEVGQMFWLMLWENLIRQFLVSFGKGISAKEDFEGDVNTLEHHQIENLMEMSFI